MTDLTTEQGRWIEINQRLDELEKSLSREWSEVRGGSLGPRTSNGYGQCAMRNSASAIMIDAATGSMPFPDCARTSRMNA
jgi:hypothetical protein